MTLVLRYIDGERFISVGDTRITLSDNGKVIGHEDDGVSKSFFACGYLISYSGLAVLNRFNGDKLTTRDWVSASLAEAQAEDKEICQTLADMASVLSGSAIIAPEYSESVLDIGLIGISSAPEDFDPDEGGEFVFDENFSFDEDAKHRYALVVIGHLTNTEPTSGGDSFRGRAKHYVPEPGKSYSSYGADMSQSTSGSLDAQIDTSMPNIDIVNSFIKAIRETADFVSDESVGRNVSVAVVPLQPLADAMGTGSLPFSERDDELLPERYVAYALVREGVEKAVMVPAEQMHFIETDQAPSPGGLIG